MAICGALVAKLELVRYDETRRGVFKTEWARDLFSECVAKQTKDEKCRFDVDAWYSEIARRSDSRARYDVNPSLHSQAIDTDWLSPLFEMEMKCEGFVMLLHNTMELEATAHDRLATTAKKELQYNFLSLNPRNVALLESAKRPPQATISDR
jgi:hypothetical protein